MIAMDDPPIWETLTGAPVEIEEDEESDADPAFRIGAQHRLFHAELRAWRQARGLKQRDLGRMVGVSGNHISQLETFRTFPAPATLEKLAEVTGIAAERLFPPWLKEWAVGPKLATSEHEITPAILESREVLALPAPDDPFDAAACEADRALLGDALEVALAKLHPRMRQVLALRFGLEDGRPRTLDEIAEELGGTRERIRQLEAKALRALRHPRLAKPLGRFLDRANLEPGLPRAKTLYTDWLYDQQHRQDQIGRHARDVVSRECCLGWSAAGLKSHVRRVHGVEPDPTIERGAAEFGMWRARQDAPAVETTEEAPPADEPTRRLYFSEHPPRPPRVPKSKSQPGPAPPTPPPQRADFPPQPGGPLLMWVQLPPRTAEEARAQLSPEQLAGWEALNATRRRLGLPEVWG